MQTVLKWIGIALGLLIVGIVILVLVFDWNWIKGYVEREASKALGRTVVIEGDLSVKLSWLPLVRIDHVRIVNASSSPEPSMLTLHRLVFRLDLREFLHGLCRKFCPRDHEGAVAPVCVGIKQPGSRTVRPQ